MNNIHKDGCRKLTKKLKKSKKKRHLMCYLPREGIEDNVGDSESESKSGMEPETSSSEEEEEETEEQKKKKAAAKRSSKELYQQIEETLKISERDIDLMERTAAKKRIVVPSDILSAKANERNIVPV